MEDLTSSVAAAKAALADTAVAAKTSVGEAKAAILSGQEAMRTNFEGVVSEASRQFNANQFDPKAVIKEENNVRYHVDGSVSVITHTGNILEDVNPDELNDILAIEAARATDAKAGATEGVLDSAKAFFGTGATLTGSLVKGGMGMLSDSPQTLNEAEEQNNFRAGLYKEGTKNAPYTAVPPGAVDAYKGFMAKAATGEELSPEDRAFANSKEFQQVFELEQTVKGSEKKFEAVDKVTKAVTDYIPATKADDLAVELAYKRIAKNSGSMDAILHILTNDAGQLVKQGFESIPYMVALTMGGPVTQTAVLITLSKDKARENTEGFIKEHNREPDNVELAQIKMWSTVSTLAEKFGDMAALKAIPAARWGRIQNTMAALDKIVPDSIKNTIKRTSLISKPALALGGEFISGAATETADQMAVHGEIKSTDDILLAGTQEAVGIVGGIGGMVGGNVAVNTAKRILSGQTPSGTDILNSALKDLQTRLDSAKPISIGETPERDPIQARIDELTDIIDSADGADTAAYVAERETLTAQLAEPASGDASAEVKRQLEEQIAAVQEAIDAQAVSPREARQAARDQAKADEAAKKERENKPADTSDITPEDFTAEVARISSDETPLQERIEAYVALGERGGMTTEQKKERAALKDVLTKANEDFANSSDPVPSMKPTKRGDHGIIDDDGTLETDDGYDRDKLEKTANDITATAVDRTHAAAQLGAQDIRAKMEARNGGTMQGVASDVREGTEDRWLGFKTYVDQINAINGRIKDIVSGVDASTIKQEVDSVLSRMRTHRNNMAKKAAVLKEAMDKSVSSGTPQYVRGNKDDGYNSKTNRVMKYTDATDEEGIAEAYKNRKTNGQYIYRLDANDNASQILIDTVTDEATYGDYMVTAAETHSQTTYAMTAGLNAKDKAKVQQQIDDINNEAPVVEDTNRASDQEIDDALDNLDAPVAPTSVVTKSPTSTTVVKIVSGTSNTKQYARDNSDTSVYTMRPNSGDNIPHVNPNQNFGNPWSAKGFQGTIKVIDIATAVDNYRQWLLGTAHQDVQPKRRAWILEQINSGFLDNKELVYFKEGYESHADVLAEVVNNRNDSTNETPTNEARSTDDSGTTEEERGPLGEAPPSADGPETTTTEEQSEDLSEESTAEENQQDDLAAEQDVLEEENYDPNVRTVEERTVEALQATDIFEENPNLPETVEVSNNPNPVNTKEQYEGMLKELDELNQIIRCLKT